MHMCDATVERLMRLEKKPRFEAQLDVMMEEEACIVSEKLLPRQKEQQLASSRNDRAVAVGYDRTQLELLQEVIQNFEKEYQDDFCNDCTWGIGSSTNVVEEEEEGNNIVVTCESHARTLKKEHNIKSKTAISMVMLESNHCRKSHYEAKLSAMGGYCGECQWGYKKSQTCDAWVEYLMMQKKKNNNNNNNNKSSGEKKKNYGSKYDAMMDAMEKDACVRDKL